MTDTRSSFRSRLVGLRVRFASALGAAVALVLLAPSLAGAATQSDTSVADFSGGTPGADTYVSDAAGGEVILTPTLGEEFAGALLPLGWSATPWTGGTAMVSGDSLHVDGARTGPDPDAGPYPYGAGRSLEFVATFGGGVDQFQHVGFGQTFDCPCPAPWAMFSVKGDGTFNARTSNAAIGGTGTDTVLSLSAPVGPQRYRIEWDTTEVRYFVNGVLVATHATTFDPDTELMRPLVSDFNLGGSEVAVDWLHMSDYPASGTFDSRVFDAGQSSEWGALSWSADEPTGTDVALSVRTGDTPTPDVTWTDFTPIASSGDDVPGGSGYLQYRAVLTTGTANLDETPVLNDVSIDYDAHPTAVDDTPTVTEDSLPSPIDALGNDTDPDGGANTIASTTQPANGDVAIVGGLSLTYQPDPDYCNNPPGSSPDTFTYTLNGGSTATVAVTVDCVDDLGTAVNDTAAVAQDSGPSAINVLVNDIDPDGGSTIASTTQPANGTVVITGGGSGLTYQPDPGYCNNPPGPDTFTYTLSPGASTATVAVTVNCPAAPPPAVDEQPAAPVETAGTASSAEQKNCNKIKKKSKKKRKKCKRKQRD